jgi:radical SAM superfamily enzyme YgiQ (UPF0313 family)
LRGEGELAFLELLEAMTKNPDILKNVNNIWSENSSEEINKTEIRPLIENLDNLPPIDFDIYNKYGYIIPYNLDMFPVITSRGCPFSSIYCFNKAYKALRGII